MPTIPTIEIVTAKAIEVSATALTLVMADKRIFIPWEKCSPWLAQASEQERLRAELSPGGYGIHWPLIDEDLSVGGLLRSYVNKR
jgi:hypothetical protein